MCNFLLPFKFYNAKFVIYISYRKEEQLLIIVSYTEKEIDLLKLENGLKNKPRECNLTGADLILTFFPIVLLC